MRFDWTQGVNKPGIVIINDYRELTEHFWKLKALYNLKKIIQSANIHSYTDQWYTSIQKI